MVKKDETLYINLLGEFSISNDYHKFRPTGRSQQMIRMVAYIVANKDVDISKEKMIDILWPGEGLDNPSGALRNLVYRCRNELERFFPESLQLLILGIQERQQVLAARFQRVENLYWSMM